MPNNLPAALAKPGAQLNMPIKDGSAPSPAAAKLVAPNAGTAPAAPLIAKAGTAPAVPTRPAPKPTTVEVVDVELVPESPPVLVPATPQIQIVKVPEDRPVWDVNHSRFDRVTGRCSRRRGERAGRGWRRLWTGPPEFARSRSARPLKAIDSRRMAS